MSLDLMLLGDIESTFSMFSLQRALIIEACLQAF